MRRFVLLALALFITIFNASRPSAQQSIENPQKRINRDPDAALLITSDIDNFWKAYDAAKTDYCLGIFKREYFDKASDGLKAFKQIWIDQCSFIETLASHPRY